MGTYDIKDKFFHCKGTYFHAKQTKNQGLKIFSGTLKKLNSVGKT